MEATPRIELGMEVLQTSALPLGYVAASPSILPSKVGPASLAVRLWSTCHSTPFGTSWRACRRAVSGSTREPQTATAGRPPPARCRAPATPHATAVHARTRHG